jgi:hypothetical protein
LAADFVELAVEGVPDEAGLGLPLAAIVYGLARLGSRWAGSHRIKRSSVKAEGPARRPSVYRLLAARGWLGVA